MTHSTTEQAPEDQLTSRRRAVTPRPRDPVDLLTRAVASLPDHLSTAAVCLCVVTSLFLVAGHFVPVAIIVVTLAAIAATWRLVPRAEQVSNRDAMGSAIVIVLVAAWFLFNRHYFAEMVSVTRDPSVYTLRGWWLMHHSSPNIPLGDAVAAAKGVPTAIPNFGGFAPVGGQLQGQGATLLPGLIALAGWAGGATALLEANIAVGAVALIVLYAFGRRLLGPLWGVVPVAALAVSMPMVYFARAPYTEPVALLLIFAGLAMLWAVWTGPPRWLFARAAFAGAAVGASQLARVDGLVAVLGTVGGLGLAAVLARDPDLRRRGRQVLYGFVVGSAIMVAVGTLDLLVNSRTYFHSESKRLVPLFAGSILATVVIIALTLIPLGAVRSFVARIARVLPAVFAALTLIGIVLLLTRPLWWTSRLITNPFIAQSLVNYQKNEGLTVDGYRSYDERTMQWLAWYVGWPVVILACLGAIVLVFHVARTRPRRWEYAPFVGALGTVSVLYLNNVSITPIQIWAMRRFLPVVLPGLLILATYVAVLLVRWRPRLMWLGAALGVGIAVAPMLPWTSLVTVAEDKGQVNEANAICHAIHTQRVVIGEIPRSGWYAPTVRIICGARTVNISDPTPKNLAQIRRQWGNQPVAFVAFSTGTGTWTRTPNSIASGTYPYWPSYISHRPRTANYQTRSVYVGTIDADGRISPTS